MQFCSLRNVRLASSHLYFSPHFLTPSRSLPFSHTLRGLDDSRLQSLGVFDSNHRRSILHKAQSGAGAELDLDNVLTDLSSVIADLEAFTVPVVSRVQIMCTCSHMYIQDNGTGCYSRMSCKLHVRV